MEVSVSFRVNGNFRYLRLLPRLGCVKVRLGKAMDTSLDFGELSSDENLKERMTGFGKDLELSGKMLETFFSRFKYEDLSLEEKVRYDLFLAFAVNSLFWMYLRTKGTDPGQHEIKSQINRVREYMNKSKSIYEKKTIMPRIDQDAAKRFVKSGLWTPENSVSAPVTQDKRLLKRKREDDDK